MKTLRRILALNAFVFAALLVSTTVFADTADVAWTNATQYTDGTAIPAGGLTATEIQYGVCDTARTGFLTSPAPVTVSVAFPGTSRSIAGFGNGTWCFRARHLAGTSLPSDWTPMVWKTVTLVPNRPGSFTVTLSL